MKDTSKICQVVEFCGFHGKKSQSHFRRLQLIDVNQWKACGREFTKAPSCGRFILDADINVPLGPRGLKFTQSTQHRVYKNVVIWSFLLETESRSHPVAHPLPSPVNGW
jgi:hypothetical protein